ncbi:MAG: ABC transporter substrate-binding protein [Betaproteobacteria bacterium]|nr:ABC transporter substrate-binding protein [Betaproteobacteria bacterium]
MDRRETVVALLALGVAPVDLFAQQPGKVWRVGFLAGEGREPFHADFTRGMRELGYVEGRNLSIEWRFANGKYEHLPTLATDLIDRRPDVLVTGSTPATRAAQKATTTIPIVMGTVGDPVGTGIVATLARPGGNVTGLSLATTDTSTKWLEFGKIVVPGVSRIAVLGNPNNPTYPIHLRNIRVAAQTVGIDVFPLDAASATEIERAFNTMSQKRVNSLIVLPDGFLGNQAQRIAQLALKHRLPSIASSRILAEAGLLISYGQDYAAYFRRAAIYVDKIFKGAKPSELPVEQPNILELIVNRKTAKALGITVPKELLLRADEVIQ